MAQFFVVVFAMFVRPVPIQAETKLALSHALVEEAKIIQIGKLLTHTTYIDVSQIFAYLDSLKTHGDSLMTHLTDDISHLSSSSLYSMEENKTSYTFFLTEGTIGPGAPGCFLIGGEAVKPENINGWKKWAEIVQQWNTANKDTTIPKPTKLIMPVKTNNEKKLIYVGTGFKGELKMDTTVENVDLVKARTAFPLFNIESQEVEYRTANEEAYVLCRLIYNDKIKEKGLWLTMAQRKEAEMQKVLNSIAATKQTLLDFLRELPEFSYTLGNKVRIETLGDLAELTEMNGDLSSHSADSMDKSGRFAVANVFFNQYIEKIRTFLEKVNLVIPNDATFSKKILFAALLPVVNAALTGLRGVSNMEPYTQSLKSSVKGSLTKYDAANKVILQEFSYYPPKISDLHFLYKIITFPLLTKEHEVVLDLPTSHLIVEATEGDTCQFIKNNFLLSHCRRLETPSFYSCFSDVLGKADSCCQELHRLDTLESVGKCGVIMFNQPANIERITYVDYNLAFVGSSLTNSNIEFLCEGDPSEKTLNESSVISSDCQIRLEGRTYKPSKIGTTSNIITPLSSLFSNLIPHLKELEVDVRSSPKYLPEFPVFNENGTIFGLGIFEWMVITASFIVSTCGCTLLIGWFSYIKKIKHRRKGRDAIDKQNYIMVNHAGRRQTLPIYNPPSAPPPFQYI